MEKYKWMENRINEMEKLVTNINCADYNNNDIDWMYGSNSQRFDEMFDTAVEDGFLEYA